MSQNGLPSALLVHLILWHRFMSDQSSLWRWSELDQLMHNLCMVLETLASHHSLDELMRAEFFIIAFEHEHFVNDAHMQSSYEHALLGYEAGIAMLPKLRDRTRYQMVDDDRRLAPGRIGEVPKDDARNALRSHATMLRNVLSGVYPLSYKRFIRCRMTCVAKTEALYEAEQRAALGVAHPD